MDFFSILTLIGGLSLFLFGMNYMGDSLKKLAGSQLEMILSKLTSSRFNGFLLGLGVTAVIQSSSATMVMLVGFVNAGIMKLVQTTSVLMGANVGTTVTGWLLSTSGISGTSVIAKLFTPSSFTPVLATVGLVMNLFSKSDRKKNIGSILIGFAILMFGMETMSDATSGLQNNPHFMDLLTDLSNPVLGILVGTVFTAIIQSSSASVGILQALCLTNAIPISSALPVILGMNIGAAVPPIISAINGNAKAKQVAASCVYIKVISVAVVASGFYALHALIGFSFMSENGTVFSLAFIHTAFNLISTIILMPFCRGIEKLSEMTFKNKPHASNLFKSLDTRFLDYPGFAARKVRDLTADVAKIAEDSVDMALTLLTNYKEDIKGKIDDQETMIDLYEDRLNAYLVALSGQPMNPAESTEVTTLSHIINNVERISDNACNIAETTKEMVDRNIVFSENALKEMQVISRALKEMVSLSVMVISENDSIAALKIEALNKVITELSYEMKSNHITRQHNRECNAEFGFIFSSLLINIGRIADHCFSIAVYLLQRENRTFAPHEYKSQMLNDNTIRLQDFYNTYRTTYTI